ncbi:sulfotransferase [Microbulbifer magnicolonia]|uniref:sulfotransferase family protein n=1 Tax=Microbulbifer magnicolonia TaxID=3109744 RepID=UPI002B40CF6F|nr:sulfotransferase [Microbulbifer sp. GG15]
MSEFFRLKSLFLRGRAAAEGRSQTRLGYQAGLFEVISSSDLNDLLDGLMSAVKASNTCVQRADACKRFSDGIFERAAGQHDKQHWCEKTPRNLLYADKIQRLYPRAKFINVVRDGREVVSSILERKFWPIAKSARFAETKHFGGDINLQKAVNYWCSLMSITAKMRDRVGADNWLDVRLEDLGGNFSKVEASIEDFLEIDHDERFASAASQLIRGGKADQRRWREGRSDREVEYMVSRMQGYLEQYGYIG